VLGGLAPEHFATQGGNPVILERDEVSGNVVRGEGVRAVYENAQIIAGSRRTKWLPRLILRPLARRCLILPGEGTHRVRVEKPGPLRGGCGGPHRRRQRSSPNPNNEQPTPNMNTRARTTSCRSPWRRCFLDPRKLRVFTRSLYPIPRVPTTDFIRDRLLTHYILSLPLEAYAVFLSGFAREAPAGAGES
jgi:hypothetical protein